MWYNIKSQNIGMSPSGKALDFDSSIRQFKSGHPSHKRGTHSGASFVVGMARSLEIDLQAACGLERVQIWLLHRLNALCS